MQYSHHFAKNNSIKFIADCHLGKLAKYLRLLGIDTLYFPHIEDDELLRIAKDEDRTILTKDRSLSQRKKAPVFFLEEKETIAKSEIEIINENTYTLIPISNAKSGISIIRDSI